MAAHKPVFINNIVSPKGRFSFPHLAKPDSTGTYADDKYKVTLLIPKESNTDVLKKAIMECAKAAWPDKNYKPKDLMLPLRDGDEKENLAGYAGTWFITAKTKKRVQCVDASRDTIDAEDCYGGAEGRLVLTAMSYEQKGRPGVTFLLELVQKTGEGERFGTGGASIAVLDDGVLDEEIARGRQPSKSADPAEEDDDCPW